MLWFHPGNHKLIVVPLTAFVSFRGFSAEGGCIQQLHHWVSLFAMMLCCFLSRIGRPPPSAQTVRHVSGLHCVCVMGPEDCKPTGWRCLEGWYVVDTWQIQSRIMFGVGFIFKERNLNKSDITRIVMWPVACQWPFLAHFCSSHFREIINSYYF